MSTEVEIDLTKKNYYDYYFFDFFVNIKENTVGFIFFFLLIIGITYFVIIGGLFFAYILFLPVLGVLIAFICSVFRQRENANILIKNGLNKIKYIFSGDKFIEDYRVEKHEYNSSAIMNVAENKNYLFLYKYHRVAWILPKNQLNESQYSDIINFLNNNKITIKHYSWC